MTNCRPRTRADRRRRYRLVLSAVAAIVAAGGGLTVTQSADAADSSATVLSFGAEMKMSGDLGNAARAESAQVSSLEGSIYAGVSIDVASQTTTVYVTKTPKQQTQDAVQAHRSFGNVQYKTVKYTQADMTTAQSALTADQSALGSEGIQITDWGPDPVTNTLHVGLVNPTSAAEEAIKKVVGIPVTFTAETAPPVATTTRLSDVPPFNGGDFMEHSGDGCTTGVPVVKNGTPYILSVAHCFGNSTGVTEYNEDFVDSRGCGSSCLVVGESTHINDSTGYDSALMSGAQYSDLDWENITPYSPPGTLNGYSEPQETYSTSVVGEYVCPSGAYEGMVCNTSVIYVKETVNISGVVIYDMDRAQNTATIPVGGGDSGGPVFTTPTNSVNIEGIIDARGDAIGCKTYTSRGSDCSYTVYYLDFASQAALWGVSLKTS